MMNEDIAQFAPTLSKEDTAGGTVGVFLHPILNYVERFLQHYDCFVRFFQADLAIRAKDHPFPPEKAERGGQTIRFILEVCTFHGLPRFPDGFKRSIQISQVAKGIGNDAECAPYELLKSRYGSSNLY